MHLIRGEVDSYEPTDFEHYELDNTEVDKKYIMYFKNKSEGCFLSEYVIPTEYVMVITDEKFNRPIGITNDGYIDGGKLFEQAIVMIKPGYHIVIFKYQLNQGFHPRCDYTLPPQIFIHRIESVDNIIDRFMFYDNKTCKVTFTNIEKFEYNHNKNYGKYNFVLDFINKRIINTNITVGSTPRFTVNNTRKYDIRLFVLENDDYISYMDNGKKLILHRKTQDCEFRYLRNKKYGQLMRIYYTRKQLDYKDYIVVDGYSVFKGFGDNIKKEIINKRNKRLVRVTTKSGFIFPAMQNNGFIYPVYSSYSGIRTFKLNNYEMSFIEKIEDGYDNF